MFYFSDDPLIIRRIRLAPDRIFLSFDDGPCPESTPAVLDVLKKNGASATFFVIGDRARENPQLLNRILSEGHAVFSHSIDHRYHHYFRGKMSALSWIRSSLEDLSQLTKTSQSAFRPPAGVLTPPLLQACRQTQTPLILWNRRFYDTVRTWNEERARTGAAEVQGGDIVLLHDRQRSDRRAIFLSSLNFFLTELRQRGFESAALTPHDIDSEVRRAN